MKKRYIIYVILFLIPILLYVFYPVNDYAFSQDPNNLNYWKRVDVNGDTTTVEAYSHNINIDGAIQITKAEYDNFIANLPLPTEPPPAKLTWATITAFHTSGKPITVQRTINDIDYQVNCDYATETIWNLYNNNNLFIGDKVLIAYEQQNGTYIIIVIDKIRIN